MNDSTMNDFTIRIVYPLERAGAGARLVLRTEHDWDRDIEGEAVDSDLFEFRVQARRSWMELKPCLRDSRNFLWSQGTNKVAHAGRVSSFYPRFHPGEGRVSNLVRVPSQRLGRDQALRIFFPAGYDENVLKRYPVLYMHDGRNLFFPEEAFMGREWRVDETLRRLHAMDRIDQTLVIGLHTEERMRDYTQPGYEAYGQALVDEVRPWIDAHLRTLTGPQHTGVMGSSLGGVASFHLAWQHPEVFGFGACLSSTFGYRDDLFERVQDRSQATRPRPRLYLDSGYPRDNYQTTQALAHALLATGFELGRDLNYFVFPDGSHDESSWGARFHLPLQLFSGKLRRGKLVT